MKASEVRAMSVQQHVLSPLTRGLFQKAVLSSGGGVSKLMTPAAPEKFYDFWHAVMANCGCKTLAAFRTVDPEKLREAQIKAGVMRYAVIIVAALPLYILYPAVQKYLIGGMMVGAVKE